MSLNGKYSLGIILAFTLLALAMLYSIPLINVITDSKSINTHVFFYSRIVLWMIMSLIFCYNAVIEKEPFFLWREKRYSLFFYIGTVVCLYFICAVGGAFINAVIMTLHREQISNKLIQLQSLFKGNYFLIISICLTAGVVEELLMRGYIQPRVEKIYHSPILGVLASAVLFGILHSTYGTIGQVVIPFFIGVVFAIFYKLYSNIKILIICHFMYDFISLMIMNFIDIKHLSSF
ncbi:type II CAAX endopeptidase family protein [Chryseobacterium sp. ISL-6]|uniref:CPBP family intramembrane glutamic endopeptidase n=1 Tax=Chryseobacterium sp. ISL-6 TaxID=2819143 RepID=UPI001BE975E6|nr:type II CAAX endopeptidase family protein [Chryseobacterium sp. ISL-6]MBT2622189.1 CPBP family intramembrane metalloprotease [Chryseobacterium sp. ISL-6]